MLAQPHLQVHQAFLLNDRIDLSGIFISLETHHLRENSSFQQAIDSSSEERVMLVQVHIDYALTLWILRVPIIAHSMNSCKIAQYRATFAQRKDILIRSVVHEHWHLFQRVYLFEFWSELCTFKWRNLSQFKVDIVQSTEGDDCATRLTHVVSI